MWHLHVIRLGGIVIPEIRKIIFFIAEIFFQGNGEFIENAVIRKEKPKVQ